MKLFTSLSLAVASLFIAGAAFAGDCACSKKEGGDSKAAVSCTHGDPNCKGGKECTCDKAEHHHGKSEHKHEHKEAHAEKSSEAAHGHSK